jgi:VRR-NUC domain.
MPDGRMLAIEIKTVKGKLSPKQQTWANILENNHACYLLARSVEDVESYMRNMGIKEQGLL